MATYASLSSLAKTIHQLKIILQTQDLQSSTSIKLSLNDDEEQHVLKETESLLQTIDFLRALLEKDTPTIIIRNTIRLQARITKTLNKAEDIIGSFLSEKYLARSERRADFTGLYHQLHRVTNDISFLVDDISKTIRKFIPYFEDGKVINYSYSSKKIARGYLAGLASEFDELESLVVGQSPDLKAVPIVGMGGIGKTTLARLFVGSSRSILEGFGIYGWVTVSKNYSARDVLVSLVQSIQSFIREPKQRNESLENYVQKILRGRRFLIVLDDVWSGEVLDFLMKIFPNDKNGSRIVLTTRLDEVAVRGNPKKEEHIMMRFLSQEDSISLLAMEVSQSGMSLDKFYVQIIAQRCKGVPLLIVLAAGILSPKGTTQDMWREVANTLLKYDVDVGTSLDKIVDALLSLSYSHLPHRLRACLLYMGAFPEDHETKVSKLTKLWLARGFLQELSASSSSEISQAEEYLYQLAERNLISAKYTKTEDNIKSCSLHDMVRDFCIKKAREEGFFGYVGTNDYDNSHLAGKRMLIAFDADNIERVCGSGSNETHTIMCFGSGRSSLISIERFRLLKTLYVPNIKLKAFPSKVLELFLLRFLAISHVPELPSSISNLQYLETLIIHPIDNFPGSLKLPNMTCMPYDIWTMPMLKHIDSFCFGPLPNPGGECSSLENLETLNAVMNLDCSENMLKMIPNIKKLGIIYFRVGRAKHCLKNLERLHRLEKLKVQVLVPFSSPQNLDLDFPKTLKKLHLRGIELSSQDTKIIGQLPTLHVLKLGHNTFEGEEWRINYGEFPQLKVIVLDHLNLRHWESDEATSLRMLGFIVVRACKQLPKIPNCALEALHQLIEVIGGNKYLVEFARSIRRGRFCRVIIRN